MVKYCMGEAGSVGRRERERGESRSSREEQERGDTARAALFAYWTGM